ncbi:MAG: acetylornithine deacetylase [Deltaproteobacteria bacterium]|nr:acetylornithine deacetylase [Deltaproteobacteria bacterium]
MTTTVRARVLAHLETLVACDTRNPPRAAAGIDRLFAYVRQELPRGFVVDEVDLGDGCRWLHARRGDDDHRLPLVNVHVDTVPLDSGWASPATGVDPFRLAVQREGGVERAVGLGACDIKGAVAAFLVAAADVDAPASLLLTTDEEAGSSKCVRTFCERHDVVDRTILVAEPTQGRAVLAHRGIGTALLTFAGFAGHASAQRATTDSAVARCVRFCSRALAHADADDNAIRLNLGRIDGGTKANMIASECLLRLGVRPPPSQPAEAVLDTLFALADPATTTAQKGFLAPALPTRFRARDVEAARAQAAERAESLGLVRGDDVDFFTEAAFFSAAGAAAMVLGPGDIAQAHTAFEWVDVDQLVMAVDTYARVLAQRMRG